MMRYEPIDTYETSTAERTDFLGRAASTHRVRIAFGALVLGVILLVLRSGDVQIVRGNAYHAAAAQNRTRTAIIVPVRGDIRDREGTMLVTNETSYSIGIVPSELPRKHERDATIAQIASVLDRPSNTLRTSLAPYPPHLTEPVIVVDALSYEEAHARFVRLTDVPAVRMVAEHERTLTATSRGIQSLAHVLGYVARMDGAQYAARAHDQYRPSDVVGKVGVEASYEHALRGIPGTQTLTIDASGRVVQAAAVTPARAGVPMTLTIDANLQAAAEYALRTGASRVGSRRGAAVLLDPSRGDVLALVSIPTYDADAFLHGLSETTYRAVINDPAKPLFPRAHAGMYPSGSTIKPVIASVAIALNVIAPTTRILSTGGIAVGGDFFPDWRDGGHGWVTVREAIAQSVNTYFYLIGGGKPRAAASSVVGPTQDEALGIDRIAVFLRAFGFGAPTTIDIPGESAGLVPDPAWKRRTRHQEWYIGDTYHLAIGQGDILVTPLQLAVATAAFANDGYRVTPRVVLRDVDSASAIPQRIPVLTEAALSAVRNGMRAAVTEGSAEGLRDLPFSVYGKTGTAEHASGKRPHAWFTGFAERERGGCARAASIAREAQPDTAWPTCIVLVVLIEEGGEGSRAAVPVAREILWSWAMHASGVPRSTAAHLSASP